MKQWSCQHVARSLSLFEAEWAMKVFEVKKEKENFKQNLSHGFLKGQIPRQGRGNKKSGLGTSSQVPMTPFKVVTVRQLLFSFSEATRTETFSCLDDTY